MTGFENSPMTDATLASVEAREGGSLAQQARAAAAEQQADQERLRQERENEKRAKALSWFETVLGRVYPEAEIHEDGAGPYTVEDNGELGTFQLRVGVERPGTWNESRTLLVVRPCVTCDEDIAERLWELYPDGFLPALGRILQEVPIHVPYCPRDLDEDGLPIPPADAEGHPVAPIFDGTGEDAWADEAGMEWPFEVEPEHTVVGDGAALDQIAAHLSGREWDSSDIETVAAFVRATGREIAEPPA